MKGVRKRGDSWSYILELPRLPDGKRRQKWQSGFRTQRLAAQARTAAQAALDAGTYQEPSRLTVAEYLEQWLTHAQGYISANTHNQYRLAVRTHLTPALGHLQLSRLNAFAIQQAYDKQPSAATVLRQHRALRRALGMAVRWGMVQNRATDGVVLPRAVRDIPDPLSLPQIQELLTSVAGSWLHLPVALAVLAGLRRGECAGLRWRDVDFSANVLTVRETRIRAGNQILNAPPKSGEPRQVTLPRALRELLLAAPPGPPEATVVQADTPDLITKRFRAFLQTSSLPQVRFHDLRHSHATLLMASGIPAKVISDRLGHSTIQVTLDLYAHVLRDSADAAAEAIDDALEKK